MVRLFFPVVATVALVISSAAGDDICKLTDIRFGGPHGRDFNDYDKIEPDMKVVAVKLQCDKRVDGFGFKVRNGVGVESILYHGSDDGKSEWVTLAPDEFINGVEVHRDEFGDKHRIFYMKISTNKNRFFDGGTAGQDTHTFSTTPGYEIVGAQGRYGDNIDEFGPIFVNRNCTQPQPPYQPPSTQYQPPSTQYQPPSTQYQPPSTQYQPPSTQY